MAAQDTIRRLKERVGELESELALRGPSVAGPVDHGERMFNRAEAEALGVVFESRGPGARFDVAGRLAEKDAEIARLKGLLARQGAKLWTETVPMTADVPRPGAPWTAPLVDAPSGKRAPHGRVAKTAKEVEKQVGAPAGGCGQFCTAYHEHVR